MKMSLFRAVTSKTTETEKTHEDLGVIATPDAKTTKKIMQIEMIEIITEERTGVIGATSTREITITLIERRTNPQWK